MKTTQFKRLAATLLFVTAMVMPSSTWAQSTITPKEPSTGDGSENSPYEISNAEELYWFAALVNGELGGETPNASAKLTADISVNSYVLDYDGTLNNNGDGFETWTPIGNGSNLYTGTFDGQGHTISGLYFNISECNIVGLFGANKGTIKNVGVVDSYFYGRDYVGGVCGANSEGGTITGCYNTGMVSGNFQVGGVCGLNDGSTITGCYNTGTVSGSNLPGGVCGINDKGTITGCYTNSGVVCENNGGTVTYCGVKNGYEFRDGTVCSLLNTALKTAKASVRFYQGTNYPELFMNVPSLVDDVYQISNKGDLYAFALIVNNGETSAKAVLTANITVNTGVLKEDGTLADNYSGFETWTPIGKDQNPYTGTFDGQGHTISGLYFNNSGSKYVGLFRKNDGTIKNVGVVDSYFCGSSYVGGVCGGNVAQNENTSITNCYNTGAVSGSSYVGGVCGYADNGSISYCYNTGAVSGSSNVGGVCGLNYGTISNCYFDNNKCNYNAVGDNSGTVTNTSGKTTEEFASGEVCYLLNGSSPYGEWGQTLSGTGKQDYPVLGGLPVYYRDEVYTNTYGILTVGTHTITTSNEPPIWYEFTPEADGNYRFSSKTILGSICVNTEMTINNMQSMSYSPSYELSAKTTYYVYLYCAPGKYDLTIEKLNSTLKTGDNEIIVSTTGRLWYEFTPSETGSYQFSSTDLEGGYLYVVKNKNATDDSRYIPYAPVYELTADNIYYVAVSYAPGTYSLTIKKLDTTLEVGTNEFEVSAPLVWYEFTPTETGSYQFSSTQLTAGNLYVNTTKTESDYTEITTSPTYDLEAATAYYVAVSATPGSYDLTITRLNNTPTAMEVVTAPQIYAVDGRIVCEGEFRIYDLLGRDVTRLNGSLSGVYVVKTANAAVKVVVR